MYNYYECKMVNSFQIILCTINTNMSNADSQIISMQSTLKHVETKIAELGHGPHTPSQAEEVKRLLASKNTIKAKLSMQYFYLFYNFVDFINCVAKFYYD